VPYVNKREAAHLISLICIGIGGILLWDAYVNLTGIGAEVEQIGRGVIIISLIWYYGKVNWKPKPSIKFPAIVPVMEEVGEGNELDEEKSPEQSRSSHIFALRLMEHSALAKCALTDSGSNRLTLCERALSVATVPLIVESR
jgi:hypothetical protein